MAEYYITKKQASEIAAQLNNQTCVTLKAGDARIQGKRVIKFAALSLDGEERPEIVTIYVVPAGYGIIWP